MTTVSSRCSSGKSAASRARATFCWRSRPQADRPTSWPDCAPRGRLAPPQSDSRGVVIRPCWRYATSPCAPPPIRHPRSSRSISWRRMRSAAWSSRSCSARRCPEAGFCPCIALHWPSPGAIRPAGTARLVADVAILHQYSAALSGWWRKPRKSYSPSGSAMLNCSWDWPNRRYFRRGSAMGWREGRASVRRWLHVPIMLFSAALLGGCFQPLYGTSTETGRGVRDSLSAVEVEQIPATANTSEAPLAVQIRNDLLFNFTGGGYPSPPTHRLKIVINGNRAVVNIDRATALPSVETYT